MQLKPPISYDAQIICLREHGMIVEDEDFARKLLSEMNYYYFTGYALQYRKSDANSDFTQPISFNSIYKIALFDKELRAFCRK